MKVKQIISESKNGERKEIIGDDLKTYHIHLRNNKWFYSIRKNEYLPVEESRA